MLLGGRETDQGVADGMRKPDKAARLQVSGGAEGRRSQGRADRSTGGDVAGGSSCTSTVGGWMTCC